MPAISLATRALPSLVARQPSASAPSSTPTPTGSGNTSVDSTPYYYFVALGIGVIFLNFWVVLTIRHLYHRRHRAEADTPSDNVDELMLTRPTALHGNLYFSMGAFETERHRRRRRMLLSDEILESKFPVVKYKVWKHTHGGDGQISGEKQETNEKEPEKRNDEINDNKENGVFSKTVSIIEENEVEGCTEKLATTDEAEQIEPIESMKHQENEKHDDVSKGNDVKNESNNSSYSLTDTVEVTEADIPEADHFETGSAHMAELNQTTSTGSYIKETYAPTAASDMEDVCAICLETMELDQDVRVLTCDHVFHDECVTRWLTQWSASCPLCKHNYYEETQTGAQETNGEGASANGQSDTHNASWTQAGRARFREWLFQGML